MKSNKMRTSRVPQDQKSPVLTLKKRIKKMDEKIELNVQHFINWLEDKKK